MKSTTIFLSVLFIGFSAFWVNESADAALTSDQRRALAAIKKNVARASSMIRRKDLEEAEKIIAAAESSLQKLLDDDKFDTNDKLVISTRKVVESQRKTLDAKKLGGKPKGGVSFVSQIAPILTQRCVRCHNAQRSSGGLNLDSFAGMKKGTQNGALLVIGNPNTSRLTQRLIAQGNQRMPRGADALPATQIQLIAAWITQGAKFDGTDEDTQLANLKKVGDPSANKPSEPTLIIPEATGDETVSFTEDIAPFMSNLCVRCHNQNRKSGGLSVATISDLMRGGDSGRVVIPGDLDASRLWDLVGKQDPIKMPRGQALITRTNWNNLKTWIVEGAKFDGDGVTTPLARLVPTEDEKKAEELSMLTPEEFADMREEQAQEMWKRVLPKARASFVRSKEFYLIGNASPDRLQELDDWAEDHAKQLRSIFGVKDGLIWKGRLVIFVFNDRFGYTEFNQVIHSRQTANEITGHSVVTPSFSDAYVALQDVEDEVSATSPGLQINLLDHLTGAFLKRSGRRLPDWVVRGTGLAMASSKAEADNPYVSALRDDAVDALEPLVDRPAEIFVDGKFSPAEIGAVGYSLVDFMLKAGGGNSGRKYGQFIARLQEGDNVAAAVKTVYQADLNALATAYFQSFAAGSKKKRR